MELLDHHAVVYSGATSVECLPAVLRTASSTVRHIVTDSLSIAEVREIGNSAQRKFSEPQHFVIVAGKILTPAQNALLKLLEEPPENVFFHLAIPEYSMLLPTVGSRVFIVDVMHAVASNDQSERLTEADSIVRDFTALSYAERLDCIAQKTKNKDTTTLQMLATGLGEVSMKDTAALKSLALLGRYFNRSGASRKMLLEYVALTLPSGKN